MHHCSLGQLTCNVPSLQIYQDGWVFKESKNSCEYLIQELIAFTTMPKGHRMELIQFVVIFQECISQLSSPTYELCLFCNCLFEVYLVKNLTGKNLCHTYCCLLSTDCRTHSFFLRKKYIIEAKVILV